MELIDLNMVDKIIRRRSFTLSEYIDSTQDSESDIEIQVDGIDHEIRNYRISRYFFIFLGLALLVFLIVNTLLFDFNRGLMFLTIVLIFFCIIVANLNSIILNKLYLIELGNQLIDVYVSQYEDMRTELDDFKQIESDVEKGFIE